MSNFPRVAAMRTVERFRERLRELALSVEAEETILKAPESPLARPLQIGPVRVGNRWAIHPMEGWDAEDDGKPSELVHRRWRNFGISGAKWVWGGEAMAVIEVDAPLSKETLQKLRALEQVISAQPIEL